MTLELHLELSKFLTPGQMNAVARSCHQLNNIYGKELYSLDAKRKTNDAFIWGVRNRKVATIRKSLKAGADILHTLVDEPYKLNAMQYAAKDGATAVIGILVEHGGLIRTTEQHGRSSLEIAIYRKRHHTVKKLIPAFVQLTKTMPAQEADDFWKATHVIAAYAGCIDIMKWLADVSTVDAHAMTEAGQGKSILEVAMEWKHMAIVKLLLDLPTTDINCVFDNDHTPLMKAILLGDDRFVDILLEKGVDVNLKTLSNAPLPMSMRFHKLATTKKLLAAGADPTPFPGLLHHATSFCDLEIMSTLLQAGLDINRRNGRGATPLMVATQTGCIDTVTFLLSRGADANQMDLLGNTALEWELSHVPEPSTFISSLIRVILPKMTVSDAKLSRFVFKALMSGLWYDNMDFLRAILEIKEVDINAVVADGETPLTLAARYSSLTVVEFLVRIPGIDIDRRNATGRSAMDIVQFGHDDKFTNQIRDLLLEKGAIMRKRKRDASGVDG